MKRLRSNLQLRSRPNQRIEPPLFDAKGEFRLTSLLRADGDLHILIQLRQQPHQFANREGARAVAHQQRDMRLLEPQHIGRLCLGQPTVFDGAIDL